MQKNKKSEFNKLKSNFHRSDIKQESVVGTI